MESKFLKFDLTAYAKFQYLRSVYSDFIASFKWVIFMTHMHGSHQFSFFWTKYVIFMIYWKFRYRWLILYYSKSTDELSPLLPALVTHVYASSISKFSVHHKYDLFCSLSRKLEWIMHMSHRYESFKIWYEIEIHGSYFFNFCVGGQVQFWKFWSE